MAGRLDLQSLRCFVAIAEERSISRAAQRLHVSQPPLTRRLRALEEALRVRLVSRSAAGVAPTAAGEELLRRARALLAEADDIERRLRGAAGARARLLRTAISAGVPMELAARVAASWKRGLPSRRIEVRNGFTQELLPGLRAGEVDFAIVGLPADLAGMRTREVYAEPMVAALPRAHPATRKKAVSFADLAGMPFFWNRRSFNPPFHDECARIFRKAGFAPRYHPVEPAQVITLERIAQGEGCTILNRWRSRTRLPGVAYRPLAPGSEMFMRFACAWPEDRDDPDLERLDAIAARVLRRATPRAPGRRA
jgi:DNA-binding transcriptional LysR family regulator